MPTPPPRKPVTPQLRERISVIVNGDTRNRFEVTFEEGQPIEIRIERWAEYTTGKRYWARCWMAERPLGVQNSQIVERAREMLVGARALPLVLGAVLTGNLL